MSLIAIRKLIVTLEEIRHEGGSPPATPLLIAVAQAVVRNPYAGRFVADLLPFMADLKSLGQTLAEKALAALEGDAKRVEAYGKGAIVGAAGELEHGALWHEPGGWAMRGVLGNTKAIVPAAKMVGALGARLMVPLGHVNAAYVRSHFSAVEAGVQDAPRADEIVYALAMATGGRIHHRAGGLKASEIKGEDGNR
ncbi:MAG: amino acid synthesis family protein [Alphaproteobacteria bacterium]|nr:amino acid synthesis family protein [Alphaproteobacteria bacterium]